MVFNIKSEFPAVVQSFAALLVFGIIWNHGCLSPATAAQDSPGIERLPLNLNLRKEQLRNGPPYAGFPEVWKTDYNKIPPGPLRPGLSHPDSRYKNSPGPVPSFRGTSYENWTPQVGKSIPDSASKIVDSEGRLAMWYAGYLEQFAEEPFALTDTETKIRFIWVRCDNLRVSS